MALRKLKGFVGCGECILGILARAFGLVIHYNIPYQTIL